MKKAIIALSILAFVAVTATAEITFGAWGRTIFVPYANSGASGVDSGAKIVPSWDWGGMDGIGAGGGRIGFTIAGKSDNVGFQIDLNGDGGSINGGDEQKMWVKPMDKIKITVGRAQDDTLRGNAAFGSFGWYRAYGSSDGSGLAENNGEDVTFNRLSTGIGDDAINNNRQGVIITATPIDALFVAVALRDVNGSVTDAAGSKTENLFKNSQIAVGYTIDGIGQVRAQYINQYSVLADDTNPTIQAAFKLTAIENLYADFGFSMTTNKDLSPMEAKIISAYAKYTMNAITVHGLAIVTTYGASPSIDMGMKIGAGVDYSMAGGIGISADVRYYNASAMTNFATATDYADAKTAFFVGATKGFSNGLIGAGLEVNSATDTGYAIPVRFEYWF